MYQMEPKLIQICEEKKSPGSRVEVFELSGWFWTTTEEVDGTQLRIKSSHKRSIYIGANSLYEACTFAHTHLPDLVVGKACFRGSIWVMQQEQFVSKKSE